MTTPFEPSNPYAAQGGERISSASGGYGQQSSYPQAPTYSGQPGYNATPAGSPPPNYMVWSIITILLCTIPGIIALVFSTQVNSKWAMGDTAGAYDSSRKAKTACLVGTIIGVVVIAVAIIMNVMAANELNNSVNEFNNLYG